MSKYLWLALVSLAVHAGAQTSAGTLTTIVDFGSTFGALPKTGVIIGSGGVLYGTLSFPPGFTVYSLTPPLQSGGSWSYASLYQVSGTELSQPVTYAPGLAMDANGVIYGVSNRVVNSACWNSACGYIYSLTPPASSGGKWTETTLYTFPRGSMPASGVLIGNGGVLYGAAKGGAGMGGVYALTPPASSAGTWTLTTLHSFAGKPDAGNPSGPLAIDNRGVLYGTTFEGGVLNRGAVFSLTPPSSASGAWTEAVLYSFKDGREGSNPGGVLVGYGSAGQPVLYGIALAGAAGGQAAYSLTSPSESSASWTFTVLYAFPTDYRLNAGPLAWGLGGALYGATFAGGAQRSGTVYALLPPSSASSSWTFRNLYTFDSGFAPPNGNLPWVGEILAVSPTGLIYGTTSGGGLVNSGTVFTLQP